MRSFQALPLVVFVLDGILARDPNKADPSACNSPCHHSRFDLWANRLQEEGNDAVARCQRSQASH